MGKNTHALLTGLFMVILIVASTGTMSFQRENPFQD